MAPAPDQSAAVAYIATAAAASFERTSKPELLSGLRISDIGCAPAGCASRSRGSPQ